jgi:putative sterol carrier protein
MAAFLRPVLLKHLVMTMKKSTGLKREIKQEKRENAANVPAAKAAPKKEFNDDKNNILEGYDENEVEPKDASNEKRLKG